MSISKIEWTEVTWNPVSGCTKISAGCLNCYAERMAKRLQAMGQKNYKNGFAVTCHVHALGIPSRWKKPRVIFVNSMGDLFHKGVLDEFVFSVFGGNATRKTTSISSINKESRSPSAAGTIVTMVRKCLDGNYPLRIATMSPG